MKNILINNFIIYIKAIFTNLLSYIETFLSFYWITYHFNKQFLCNF